jgi:hypothetical protein
VRLRTIGWCEAPRISDAESARHPESDVAMDYDENCRHKVMARLHQADAQSCGEFWKGAAGVAFGGVWRCACAPNYAARMPAVR